MMQDHSVYMRKEVLTPATTQVNLEDITLSDIGAVEMTAVMATMVRMYLVLLNRCSDDAFYIMCILPR